MEDDLIFDIEVNADYTDDCACEIGNVNSEERKKITKNILTGKLQNSVSQLTLLAGNTEIDDEFMEIFKTKIMLIRLNIVGRDHKISNDCLNYFKRRIPSFEINGSRYEKR